MGDLFEDLKDGILLVKLLENLTKKRVAGFNGSTPKTEAHKRVNLDLAFQFMQTENIKMIGVGKINLTWCCCTESERNQLLSYYILSQHCREVVFLFWRSFGGRDNILSFCRMFQGKCLHVVVSRL